MRTVPSEPASAAAPHPESDRSRSEPAAPTSAAVTSRAPFVSRASRSAAAPRLARPPYGEPAASSAERRPITRSSAASSRAAARRALQWTPRPRRSSSRAATRSAIVGPVRSLQGVLHLGAADGVVEQLAGQVCRGIANDALERRAGEHSLDETLERLSRGAGAPSARARLTAWVASGAARSRLGGLLEVPPAGGLRPAGRRDRPGTAAHQRRARERPSRRDAASRPSCMPRPNVSAASPTVTSSGCRAPGRCRHSPAAASVDAAEAVADEASRQPHRRVDVDESASDLVPASRPSNGRCSGGRGAAMCARACVHPYDGRGVRHRHDRGDRRRGRRHAARMREEAHPTGRCPARPAVTLPEAPVGRRTHDAQT